METFESAARQEQAMPGQIEKQAMRPEDLTGQIELIQAVMRRVMKEGEHYGKIPGTDKLTLLQPGAEKLILTFRLGTEFTVLKSTEEPELLSYTVRCDLFHLPTGAKVASGVGSCNSRESRYRYRFLPSELKPSKAEAERLKARGLGRWRKMGEAWVWHERIENDNPWDFQNTILKMAAKRAKVAATLNATAASDIFTQDLEDMEFLTGERQTRPEEASPRRELKGRRAEAAEQRSASGTGGTDRTGGEQQATDSAGSADFLDALRREVEAKTSITALEDLWRERAKSFETSPHYQDIRRLFLGQRQFILEAQALEQSGSQGEAA